jgi:dTDP-4-dehydrorhamnose reductase
MLERVLVTGGGGQLASDLVELLGDRAEVRAPARAELDITDGPALERAFEELRPDTVFNCAAFHNLDVCEREEDRSFEVNGRAVKRMAERCRDTGAKLIHLSTNYVFDGQGDRPYLEDDLPAPRSVYAISKLAGEQMALAYEPGALVVRSSGLYGLHGSASKGGNFVQRMLGRAREQGEVKMVEDQRLTPTFTADLAAGLIAAVEAGEQGVLHMTNSGECSWYEFTLEIFSLAGVEAEVEPVTTTIPPGGVDRPLNGVLGTRSGLEPLRPWQDALADYMARAGLRSGVAQSP